MIIGRKPKSQQLSITYLPPTELCDDPKNPRLHSEKQLRQLERSVTTFGFLVPILIDAQSKIVAGHGRVQAARRLQLKTVPTIQVAHLSEAQRAAFALADNRLAENATWDDRLLGEQLKILSELNLDFSLETIGFEMAEIDLLIEGAQATDAGDPEEEIEDTLQDPVTVAEDLWLLGPHRLLCGNSLEPASYRYLMAGRMAAAVVADPPYNVRIDGHASGLGKTRHREFAMAAGEMSEEQFTAFLKGAMDASRAHTARGSLAYWFIDWRHVGEMKSASRESYSTLLNICVWSKDRAGMGSFYRSAHELIFVLRNGEEAHRNNIQLGKFGRYRTNVWNYPGASSQSRSAAGENLLEMHPTVKPIALVADAILDCSARGDVVLDPFLGSGTTILAAERTGRVCYGIELDPLYVDLAVRRWQRLTGEMAVHAVSGKTFADVEAAHGA